MLVLQNDFIPYDKIMKATLVGIQITVSRTFFAQYRENSQKFSKKAITWLQRPMETNAFRPMLISLRPNCGSNTSSNGGGHLG
jgi:hypothetical protein